MKNAVLSLSLALLLPCFCPAGARAADPPAGRAIIPPGAVLSLAQCLETADRSHPQIASARASAAAGAAGLGLAESAYRPRLDGSLSASRVSPTAGPDADQYSGGLTLTQNLYDFGRTRGRVAASRADLAGAQEDLADARALIAHGVRRAYFALLRATRSREVAKENLAQSERGLAQARGFFEAGTKTRFDVTTAEVTHANARLALISAENAVRIAVTSLANAMGVSEGGEFSVEDTLGAQEPPIPYADALARALSVRSDLRSRDAAVEAAGRSLAAAEAEAYPSLDGRAGYTLSGQDTPLDESWSAGVTLSLPLYTGGYTGYQAAAARASLEGALAVREQLRQSISAEVQQAIFNAAEAAERIPTAELSVRQAQDNLDLANGRYQAGVGSPIEVADAQTAMFNQKNAHIQALYDYQAALAALKKAMGER